jgi:hypothetical protein
MDAINGHREYELCFETSVFLAAAIRRPSGWR